MTVETWVDQEISFLTSFNETSDFEYLIQKYDVLSNGSIDY